MDLDLVGYLLDVLDSEERARVEGALRTDPSARREFDRVRATLAPLAADRPDEPPPPGLAERTIAFVAAHTGDRPRPYSHVTAPSERPSYQPSRWRRADALVAAAILIVLGGLGASGLGRLRYNYEVTACQNNLRQLHQALASFSHQHDGHFPQIAELPPRNIAGAFVPMLLEAGTLPTGGTPNCPIAIKAAGLPSAGYAYSLGYRDGDGVLHGLRADDSPFGNDLLPITADRQAPTSHGNGHNVLFIGGHVRFCTSPYVGVSGDNVFVNLESRVAAGLHRLDSVLGASDTSP
jgi:prepilin-type processing-associated H-X9-DG protein